MAADDGCLCRWININWQSDRMTGYKPGPVSLGVSVRVCAHVRQTSARVGVLRSSCPYLLPLSSTHIINWDCGAPYFGSHTVLEHLVPVPKQVCSAARPNAHTYTRRLGVRVGGKEERGDWGAKKKKPANISTNKLSHIEAPTCAHRQIPTPAPRLLAPHQKASSGVHTCTHPAAVNPVSVPLPWAV